LSACGRIFDLDDYLDQHFSLIEQAQKNTTPTMADINGSLLGGHERLDAKRLRSRVECFEASLALEPDYADAWNHLGMAGTGKVCGRLYRQVE